jgi:hypothetical protein
MRMADHGLVLKDLASYPASGMTNGNCEDPSVRIAGIWAEIFDLRPRKYEAEALTTRLPDSVK